MPKNSKQTSERRRTAGSLDAVVGHGDQKLIEVIQAAVNELKVPESCEGKMRGEYVKCGMRLAVEAINAAIAKHKASAAMSNQWTTAAGNQVFTAIDTSRASEFLTFRLDRVKNYRLHGFKLLSPAKFAAYQGNKNLAAFAPALVRA